MDGRLTPHAPSESYGYSTPNLRLASPCSPSTPHTEYSDDEYFDEVAVVGMACRVAGGNNTPEQLWEFILEKKDASCEIPAMRWEPYRRRDARNAHILEQTTSRGYFLEHLEDFDAQFFGISPKEAEQMDPQQRLSLEVAWEALENAGIPPQSLSGSDTAVFWGVNSDDYSKLLLEDIPNIEAWMGIGTAYCGVPNRISYHLNLMGPSTAIDAACASSLVAIHHGRQAILQGESKLAIVGGVNALCGPGLTVVLDKAGAISPEGCCRSFDDDAKGYGRGEGAGAVVLKRLKDAVMDGDHILALIKGSAVTQDGHTNGIMAPNGKAQELAAKKALDLAGVDPLTVRYVEAHATSTPLGDPTEISALGNVYGVGRTIEDPCFIGSIKPNIGHLEAGAGVMGFIKAVLAMNKGVLPPQANLRKLNSKIDWEKIGVRVVQDAIEWPASDKPRRAGVCSYGYGGTVSHAVIEEFAPGISLDMYAEQRQTGPTILLLSAPQEKRLAVQASTQRQWLLSDGLKHNLSSIAATLATRRLHHDHRVALVVDNHEDAANALEAVAQGSKCAWTAQGRLLCPETSRDTVWLFSGHGAQWKEMGRELLQNYAFLEAITPLEEIIKTEMGFSTIQALQSGDFGTSDRVQALTYVMQLGLSAVLKSKGITPQAIIGHSVGEVAASVVAGALTAKEGAIIVCRRALLYRGVMGLGSMVLVNSPFSEIEQELHERTDIVAAIDASPSSCVVAGATATVAEFTAAWNARCIKTHKVNADIAFHSPMLAELAEPLCQALSDALSPRQPAIKLYSTSLTNPRSEEIRGSNYWVNNMINPVRLRSAVNAAIDDGYKVFIEVSSHPIISHSVNETLLDCDIEEYAVIPTLLRNKPTEKSILYSIAQLHCQGVEIDWKKHLPGNWAPGLPTTRWSHKPFWRKIETGPLNTSLTHDARKHTLLGQRIKLSSASTVVHTTRLDDNNKPFPGDHPVVGTEIVPAAVLINTFVQATGAKYLHQVALRVPVATSPTREVQVEVCQDQVKLVSRLTQEAEYSSVDDASWVTHTTAQWSDLDESPGDKDIDSHINIDALKSRIRTRLANNFSIDYLDKVGVSAMGFPWSVTEHWGNGKEMIARVDLTPHMAPDAPLPWDPHSWAPILDAATSVASTLFFHEPRLRMPAEIDRVTIYTHIPPQKTGWLYVQEVSNTALASDVSVLSDDGQILVKFTSMRFSEIEGAPGISGSVGNLVHQLAWPPASLTEIPLSVRRAIFVSKDVERVERYIQNLSNRVESLRLPSARELVAEGFGLKLDQESIIVYVPEQVNSLDDVGPATERYTWELLDIVKYVVNALLPTKIFVVTDRVAQAETPTALAQAPLHGLSRIIASEHPDVFGGLIDNEDSTFPYLAIKYVQGADVIRMIDGVPRISRLRPMPRDKLLPAKHASSILPTPEGTYIVTGGLGALGLEVAEFLVERGARRLILISRRALPSRKEWGKVTDPYDGIVAKIRQLENCGASVHVISIDIGAKDAAQQLSTAIEALSLPPVLGVVHVAGIVEDQVVLKTTAESFSRVLSPKVNGALALHGLFPPTTLDFFILFSSCGQLFGFPAQSSYASGNAFLDNLATHRRNLGDNAVSFQWTCWRGLGMASGANTDFLNAELECKGITDVTRDDAFRAWLHVARYDTDHAVVLRSLAFAQGESPPVPILNDIAPRRGCSCHSAGPAASKTDAITAVDTPKSGPELKTYLDMKIRGCVANVLQSSVEDVDSHAALSAMGMDSVMMVSLRQQLQTALKVKVPPTLTWTYPTIGHLAGWFAEKLESPAAS